jgi:hypothetical protein
LDLENCIVYLLKAFILCELACFREWQ